MHAEEAYGLARTGQTIVNVPDATVIRLYVDDEPLFLPTARLRRLRARASTCATGTLRRELDWSTAGGQARHGSARAGSSRSSTATSAAISYEVTWSTTGGAGRDLLAAGQPPGRAARRRAARHRHGADPRLRQALRRSACSTPAIVERRRPRSCIGYRTANSGMTLGRRRGPRRSRPTRRTRRPTTCRRATAARSCSPSTPSPACRSGSPSTSPTTPRARCRRASCVDRCGAHAGPRRAATGFDALAAAQREHLDRLLGPRRRPGRRGRRDRGSSRRSAGTCSSSRRRPGAPRAPASRPRG